MEGKDARLANFILLSFKDDPQPKFFENLKKLLETLIIICQDTCMCIQNPLVKYFSKIANIK